MARRVTAGRRGPALTAALLGALALTELVVRLVAYSGSIWQLGQTQSIVQSGIAGVRPAIPAIPATPAASVGTPAAFVLALLCLATTLPLAFRRPAPAAIAICAASILSLALFRMLTVAGLSAQLIACYRLGRRGSQVLAVVLALPFLILALSGPARGETQVVAVLLAALTPVAALTGSARRARSEAAAHSADRHVAAGTLLEHTARGERARIARELHDVVAHHISMVVVQAETARLTTPGMPAAGAQRLSEIGDTARASLTEMRRLLGVLREDAEIEAAQRQPQPGLRQLIDLIDEARDAGGAAARLIVSGPPGTLDPGVELAAYRIAQEALTNARRHAPGAAVDVELHYTADSLDLRIRDNGPGSPPVPPEGGHGLLGMRERAAAVGGQLRTGPAAGGGFLVQASLPAKAEVAV
ncbi:MAG TPA: sensor histidine kinase [Streptosporangiaceae bacterium]|jgi:signal transduction histidine kinase|nr:sensor histidine kinase [Streptosporangiaceae bacterium]